ncbi:MAG: large conductance mechanosensitive channel protein MscL [Candidatus Gracilibacteria bacterium]|nr:large conductance mechanosensitive channel protein MscL [Candidatus Gracilibacteria bacterium]
MLKDFKNFLIKGNAIDLAVGFMFGAAFANVVKSFIENIVMPPIGLLLGKVDFSNLYIALDGNTYDSIDALNKAGAPAIKYGSFITDSVSFIILGFIIFMMINALNKLKKEEAAAPHEDPADIKLLTEIRDALVQKK